MTYGYTSIHFCAAFSFATTISSLPLRRAITPTVSQSSGKASVWKVSRVMKRLFPSASWQRMSPFFGWQVSTFTPSTLITFVS